MSSGRIEELEIDEWKAQIERERREKDVFFAEHRQSPIPPQDRAEFRGLDYYPPDPDCRFEIELHEHEEKKTVRIAYTKGKERDFIRWGEFRFEIGSKGHTLQAYTPWCAYSDAYICPFTPPENRLDTPIYAGEKNYRGRKVKHG
jgi:uncharacterized protein (DUF1684 family)